MLMSKMFDDDALVSVQIGIERKQPNITGRALASAILSGGIFQIPTPVTKALAEFVAHSFEMGDFGALVYGKWRIGKTSASRWTIKLLGKLTKCRIPWTEIPFRRMSNVPEREFFAYFLMRAGHPYKSGTIGDLKTRLSEMFIKHALASELRTYVLFIDEAQYLKQIHYEWLLNISNEMNEEGCRLFCLLTGSAKLLQVKAELEFTGQEQLVARFLLPEFEVLGIRSLDDILACLTGFNNHQWPPHSGQTIPQLFIPELCAAGFHLQQLGPRMWAEFQAIMNLNPSETQSVHMWYFTRAMLTYLSRRSELEINDSDDELLIHAVRTSGLLESIRMNNRLEKEGEDADDSEQVRAQNRPRKGRKAVVNRASERCGRGRR